MIKQIESFWKHQIIDKESMYPGFCKACATMSPSEMILWENSKIGYRDYEKSMEYKQIQEAERLGLDYEDFHELMIAVFDPEFMRSLWSDKNELPASPG